MSEKEFRPLQSDPPIWKPDEGFVIRAREVLALRAGEKRGGNIEVRTQLILSLFLSTEGNSESFIEKYIYQGAPFSLWCDANGLRLDIGLTAADGIHSHIPYENVSSEVLARIIDKQLCDSPAQTLELQIRVALATGKSEEAKTLAGMQTTTLQETLASTNITMKEKPLVEQVVEAPDQIARILIQERGAVPYTLISDLLDRGEVWSLMRIASALNGGYEGKDGDPFYTAQHRDAWRSLHISTHASRFNRSVFSSRAETLHTSSLNAEAAKIIESIFTRFDYASLTRSGIRTIRGTYKDGLEFVGFFFGDSYERVLLEPKKHIRGTKARDAYESIPVVSGSDLEACEGFLLPYVQFQSLARALDELFLVETQSPQHFKDISSYIEGILSLLIPDMDPIAYEPFLTKSRELMHALAYPPLDPAVRDAFRTELEAIRARYGKRFSEASLPQILDTYLRLPERSSVSFDANFIASAPQDMQAGIRAYLESLPVQNPQVTVVQSGTEEGIPHVLEGRALRALKISPRPTLVLITGAKFEDVDDQERIDQIADSIIAIGKETGANIFMQGTQSGKIAETIVRKYWKYRASLADEAEPAFRVLAIEPGKSTYAGELGYAHAELRGPHPLLPIDTILTPHVAGWSAGEGDTHSYATHVLYRQSVIRHASEGNPVATLVINGGSWSVAEATESVKDGFAQIVLPSSGRLASFIGHLHRTREQWLRGGVPAALGELESFIQSQPEEKRAFLVQDLERMKKRGLDAYIEALSRGDTVQTAEIDTLKGLLREALKVQE